MIVFRIAKEKFIGDLSGIGASLYGGRWNKKGTLVVYTASSRALATVEFIVHLPHALMPCNLKICSISIPDDIQAETIKPKELPENWKSVPAPFKLAEIGSLWIKQCSSLILKVPSAIVEDEYNILINAAHKDIKNISIIETKNYIFDRRLLREQKQKK